MTKPARNRRVFLAAGCSAAAATLSTAARLRAEEAQDDAPKSQLAKDMIGAWELTGTPEQPNGAPAETRSVKFRTGKSWGVTYYTRATGAVVYHHGGSYTVDGETYEESVEYATEATKEIIGQKFKFKVKVEGDTFTQIGDGNPYNEVWKRIK